MITEGEQVFGCSFEIISFQKRHILILNNVVHSAHKNSESIGSIKCFFATFNKTVAQVSLLLSDDFIQYFPPTERYRL